jgi:hypothetical protein
MHGNEARGAERASSGTAIIEHRAKPMLDDGY